MNFTYSTIIVKADDRLAAQALSSPEYFNAEASADGLVPPTHYFMSGPFDNTEVDAIINGNFEKWVRSDDWQAALSSLGLTQIIPMEMQL